MGKSSSKLKHKRSGSNLTWPRFGSRLSLKHFRHDTAQHNDYITRAIDATNTEINANKRKHLDIKQWLKILDLEHYEDHFEKFSGVEDLLEFSEADIKELGVKKSSHRALMMSSITALKAKYHDLRRDHFIRHSVAVDTRKKIQQDDSISDIKTVYEAIQTKSLNNLIMEPCADPSMDTAALKKALEWELSLDGRDIRSHAWYHGAIPRSRAEEIVREEGGFLVRDCTSQPGNYVLTCRTKLQPLHFVIKKTILQPETVYERVQYQFEDDPFDTVPDLITSYVGSGKPITAASGARIQFPKNRMYPLSFYASKYPAPIQHQNRLISPSTPGCGSLRYNPMQHSHSPTRLSNPSPPKLPSKKQRSQSLTPSEVNRIAQEKCYSADGVIQPVMTRSVGSDTINNLNYKFASLPRTSCTRLSISPSTGTLGRHIRLCSDTSLCEDETPESPPPKPSRFPRDCETILDKTSLDGNFHGYLQRVTSYHASGSDSGNGSGDSALSSAAGDSIELTSTHRNSGVIIKNPRYNLATSESTTTLKNFDFDYVAAEEKLLQLEQLELDVASKFDLESFYTLLLPIADNKPLDSDALIKIKLILKDNGSRILANHLTRIDFDLIFDGYKNEQSSKFGSGIELCTLPHGRQFRLDLLERTECLKLLVAVTILTCPDESERAEMLNKWIEVAIDTKTALGNLYGFCGIMLGLCSPQVERLNSTWHLLRQKHTDSAFNFESKLRPTLKSMNSCSNPQAPNTTIPHLIPYILLIERNLEDFITPNCHNFLTANCLTAWEVNSHDFGLSILLAHLDSARKFVNLCNTFHRNAEIVLGEARMDDLTLEMFRTEFQLKFLWGSRGAYSPPLERHSKFEQLLEVIADKYCNNGQQGVEV
ncbi:SH2 domain-containing protein 3C isoform X2 [Onthophagus taurus]|uniref:SH2 domain-containing protein 3C isoform X2 n=1 Tax=Onthophagus taurus TaxID=166361 RepID=UPI0039BE18EB